MEGRGLCLPRWKGREVYVCMQNAWRVRWDDGGRFWTSGYFDRNLISFLYIYQVIGSGPPDNWAT